MKSYQIVYAVAVRGSLEIETVDFRNEADARRAMATLRNMSVRIARRGRNQCTSSGSPMFSTISPSAGTFCAA